MKVVRTKEVPETRDNTPRMIGVVTQQPLVRKQADSTYCSLTMVNFGKGARTKFHSHSVEQVLVCTAGNGIVATESEQIPVRIGDIVIFPSGEKHWHGAAKDSEFSHISITSLDNETKWLES